MAKSATDLMQEILFSTVLDSIVALKDASNGMPNPLLRELNSIHPNTTYADLPREVQAAIATNVRSAFTRLLKEGYSVAQGGGEPRRGPPPGATPTHRPRGGGSDRRPPREGGSDRRPPRDGGQGPKRGPGNKPRRP